eukprot:3599791-Pleurochrysis_carterae.AAC.1
MLPLLEANYTVLRAWLSRSVDEYSAYLKEMDNNVALLKGFFMDQAGSDWSTANGSNANSHLGITRGRSTCTVKLLA